jgi:hypothetical protein
MNDSQVAEQLAALYLRAVTHHATTAWRAGRGNALLTVLDRTLRTYRLEPRNCHPDGSNCASHDPYDAYLRQVHAGVSLLRENDCALILLAALQMSATSGPAPTKRPDVRALATARTRLRRRARGTPAVLRQPTRGGRHE